MGGSSYKHVLWQGCIYNLIIICVVQWALLIIYNVKELQLYQSDQIWRKGIVRSHLHLNYINPVSQLVPIFSYIYKCTHTFADLFLYLYLASLSLTQCQQNTVQKRCFIDVIRDVKWKPFSSENLPSSKSTFLFMETYWF